MDSKQQAAWQNLSKDARALELAKSAMGWDSLTWAQRAAKHGELVVKAQQFKGAL
jgi:hypothetical protein